MNLTYRLSFKEYSVMCKKLSFTPTKDNFDFLDNYLEKLDKSNIQVVQSHKFFSKIKKNYLNLIYLDLYTRLFLKQHAIRYQLNTIIAIHERDVCEIKKITNNYQGKANIIFRLTKLTIYITFAFLTLPIWLLLILAFYKINYVFKIFSK